ncbi:hypothetical protein ACQ4PT_029493 [Festuca glaucescens]
MPVVSRSFRHCARYLLDEMASGGDDLGEAGIGPETRRVHDWVPKGMELRFAFLVNIRRERFIVDAKDQKKFQGGFDYRLPMDCNLSFRQFGEAENRDEADNDAFVIDDEEGEDEDLPPIEWDPENPQMEEGSIFASMSECRNALVTYCIKAEHTFEVDKSDTVKVNPFRHTCLESTLRKETISRAKSRWVAEEVKRWVTENHQVGTKELQKKLKEKFKIEVPYMRVFNGKQHAMDSIYVDPVFGECFDAPNDEQNDEQSDEPNEDAMDATNDEQTDDQNEDPMEATSDDPIEDPIEAPIDDPIEASNDEQQNDQNDDPIDDSIEASNDEQIEAPNVGVQPSMVVSSTCSVVGSNKVVEVSSEVVKVPTTKRRRKEAMSTRITRSKVVEMSTRITRSKVVARSTRTKKKSQRFVHD